MFRVSQKLISRHNLALCQRARNHSQQTSKSGGAGKAAAIGLGGATATLGGIVGYAALSDDNRKAVDSSIPGIDYITNAVLGKQAPPSLPPSKPVPAVKPAAPSTTASTVSVTKKDEAKSEPSSLVEKKMEREKQKKKSEVQEQVKDKPAVKTSKPSSSAPSPPVASKKDDSKKKVAAAAIATSAVALTTATKDANKSVTSALEAAEQAAEVVQKQVMAAIKDMGEGSLAEGIKAKIGAAVTSAEEALEKAQSCLGKLNDTIVASKKDGESSNDNLVVAEQTINELAPAIGKVKSVIANSINSMLTFDTLNEAMREAKNKLSTELDDLIPGASKLDSEKQLQLMLGQAYLRAASLQKNLTDKLKAMEELRESGGREAVSETVLQGELDKLRHQLTLQHRSDLARQTEEMEAEVRGQLKRQAAAHSEHLTDMLSQKEQQITKAWQTKLFDEIIKEKNRHLKEIAAIKGRVQGLQTAVVGRADADKAAHGARRLWLACNSFLNAIRLGQAEASSFSDQLLPLDRHIAAVSVAGVDDEFVGAVVGSLDGSVAAQRGVYTEQALKHRFNRVATVARRVALVPENGGSLIRYLLSYIQSMLIITSTPATAEAMLFDSPVDIDSLNTFDILDRAAVCLAADDMAGCVRWLNQLTGESRNVAKDWCAEARRTLEARQAAAALMAHAATVVANAV